MATAGTPAPAKAPEPEQAHVQAQPKWRRFVVPALIVLLAVVIFVTITRNWNAWEGGRVEQVTDDAYVRGDLTPLSTKVAGIVRDVKVTDYQQVRKGQLIVELEDDDFQAQLDQATAAVEAAKAAIENNHRQRELQDAKIERALAGIDQAKAQIVAAQAGIDAVQADVVRARRRACSPGSALADALVHAAESGAGGGRRRKARRPACKSEGRSGGSKDCAAQQRRRGGSREARRKRCWNLRIYNSSPTCMRRKQR